MALSAAVQLVNLITYRQEHHQHVVRKIVFSYKFGWFTSSPNCKTMNFWIRPINGPFCCLCSSTRAEHESLLMHAEVRWLSRGKVGQGLHELRNEMKISLLEDKYTKTDVLRNPPLDCTFGKPCWHFWRVESADARNDGSKTGSFSRF